MTEAVKAYIHLKNVSFSYGRTKFQQPFGLRNISLELFKNGITVLTGGNGTGKTTLGKLTAGILKPDSGEVLIDGLDTKVTDLGVTGSKANYLFQNPEKQIFATSVQEDICFSLKINGSGNKEVESKAQIVMRQLGILHLKDKYPFNLSQGEKQRTALAGILIREPEFLILDEPTSALDTESKVLLAEILNGLNAKGTGVLIITHDLKFANICGAKVIKLTNEGLENA